MHKRVALLAAMLLSGAASAQSDALPPAAASDIAGAVTDCWNAVEASQVNRATLDAAGWKVAVPTDAKGNSSATPLLLYTRAGRQAVIMLANGASQPMCSVIARVAAPEELGQTVGTVQRALVASNTQLKTARDGNTIVFPAWPKLAMADLTGTKDKPGVRIVVGYQNSEKK